MDVHGKHIKEWADVLAKVEEMVKVMPVSERGSIAYANGNSLEQLAKNCEISHNDKITYLPSRSGPGYDRHIIRLRRNKPDIFRKVVSGELTMIDARRAAGLRPDNHTNLGRAKAYFRSLACSEGATAVEANDDFVLVNLSRQNRRYRPVADHGTGGGISRGSRGRCRRGSLSRSVKLPPKQKSIPAQRTSSSDVEARM